MNGLYVGVMVHIVMPNSIHRPAVVVNICDPNVGTVNLDVFTDGPNDVAQYHLDGSLETLPGAEFGILWKTCSVYSATQEPLTWHWMETA